MIEYFFKMLSQSDDMATRKFGCCTSALQNLKLRQVLARKLNEKAVKLAQQCLDTNFWATITQNRGKVRQLRCTA